MTAYNLTLAMISLIYLNKRKAYADFTEISFILLTAEITTSQEGPIDKAFLCASKATDVLECMCSCHTCMPVGLSRFHQSLSIPKTKALAKPWSGADRTCNRVRVNDGLCE